MSLSFRIRLLVALSLILLAVAAGACAPATPAPTETPVPSATPLPATDTPVPSSTATLTLVPSLTPTLTLTPTITFTPTPAASFDKLQILAADSVVGGIRLTLSIPGVSVAYKLKAKGSDFTCTYDPQYPNRLFCMGLAEIAPGENVVLAFLDPNSGEKVYEGEAYYPGASTALPSGIYGDCADRGKGANCETECRQLPQGGFCVVATCTDACGLYFSVHSCPEGMDDFASCTPDQWAEAKRLYSLP